MQASKSPLVALSSPKDWINPWGLTRIRGVEIGEAGVFVDMNGRDVKITSQNLSQMSRRDIAPADRPGCHIGHPNTLFLGELPNICFLESIYTEDGQKLKADLAGLHIYYASQIIETGGYPRRSMELARTEDDSWRVLAVGFTGASGAAIEGMAMISADQVEWMTPEEHEDMPAMLSSASCRDVVCLAGAKPAEKENDMAEISLAQFEELKTSLNSLSGEITTLKTSLAEKDAKLAENEAKVVELSGQVVAQASQNTMLQMAHAQGEVVQLTSNLQGQRRIPPVTNDPEGGDLPGWLLHVKLHCPPRTMPDGKPMDAYTGLSGALNTLPSITPPGRSLAQPGTPPAYELVGDDPQKDQKAQLAAHMEKNPKATMQQALYALARGGRQ